MKREAFLHPKMLDLAARLDCNRAQAIGYITLLIDWVANFAIQGDVGKWPNGAIARGCEWHDNPDVFIDALISSGWLDTHEGYRLVLHDWPDHCESWVKAKMAKQRLSFLDYYGDDATPCSEPLEGTSEATDPGGQSDLESTSEPSTRARAHTSRDQTKPNQTKPNPPPPPTPSRPEAAEAEAALDWHSLMSRLVDLGMADARGACESAKANGLPLGEAVAIVEHWTTAPAGDWDLAALHYRLKRAVAGAEASAGWPKPKRPPAAKAQDPELDAELKRAKEIRQQRKQRGGVA